MKFVSTFIGTLFVAAFVVFLAGVMGGLVLMLLLGVLHDEVSTAVPTLGYWTSVALMMLAGSTLRLLMWPTPASK